MLNTLQVCQMWYVFSQAANFLFTVTRAQVLNVERTCNESPEKLATGLLLLLFTSDDLSSGNCTKPMRKDIHQLDIERLWAIKCKE